MAKAAVIKTQQNDASVEAFLHAIPDEQKRKDCYVILHLMQKTSKEKPKMWGSAIIGFGLKRYKSPRSGREADWFKIGFSARKANLSLHLINMQQHAEALKKLGKHTTGNGCLYIHKLADVDSKVLEKIIAASVK
jgi:hypothetical protein